MLILDRWLLANTPARPAAVLVAFALLFSFADASAAEDEQRRSESATVSIQVLHAYTRIAEAVYCDSRDAAEVLRDRIGEFLAAPSAEALEMARAAWLEARKPYLQSEVFRFCEGPIDQLEGRINAWPIDENYIDYVAEEPHAGIVNDLARFPALSRALVESLNEQEGEKNISAGFHAIEFLLWGQDCRAEGAGNRSYRDYVDGPESTAPNPERRRQYLWILAELLVDDLRVLANAWADGDPLNYRSWFLASAPHQAHAKILHGIGTLGGVELAGERLTVPYETKEQEDEHSCFSDTTHLDILHNAVGIQNIYFGRYARRDGTWVSGVGVDALLSAIDPSLARELAAQVDASVDAARAIPAPFDQAVLGKGTAPGRQAVRRMIQTLEAQTAPLARALSLVGVRERQVARLE